MAPRKDLRHLTAARNAIYKAEYKEYRRAKLQREVDAWLTKAKQADEPCSSTKKFKADEPCSSTKK